MKNSKVSHQGKLHTVLIELITVADLAMRFLKLFTPFFKKFILALLLLLVDKFADCVFKQFQFLVVAAVCQWLVSSRDYISSWRRTVLFYL